MIIGNKYLKELYDYKNENLALSQLLEYLKFKNEGFMKELYNNPINLDLCNEDELIFLTIASAIIEYKLLLSELDVPLWVSDERLFLEHPYFCPKRYTGYDKFRLRYTSPPSFKVRNVYFDVYSLTRV